MARKQPPDDRDKAVERLREFIRFGYVSASEVARHIGVRDSSVYSWLLGEFRPAKPERITAFLDSLPAESGSGIAPTGYEYKPYPTPPKPNRRCPFCYQAEGEIRKARGGFLGICPTCGANGPKRESRDEALRAWNGR